MAHERRFFVESSEIDGGRVAFSEHDAAHMRRSLRLHKGSRIVAVTDTGAEYEVELETVTDRIARGKIVMQLSGPVSVGLEIWLVQSLPKGRHKTDLIVRQTTEVGVDHIRFVPTERSNAVLREDRVEARLDRWKRVAREAASQSRRSRVPTVGVQDSLDAVVDELPEACAMLVAWEDEPDTGLAEIIKKIGSDPGSIAVFVGPEGGFSTGECEFMKSVGARTFRLGSTVLRSETAAPVITALVLHELGLM